MSHRSRAAFPRLLVTIAIAIVTVVSGVPVPALAEAVDEVGDFAEESISVESVTDDESEEPESVNGDDSLADDEERENTIVVADEQYTSDDERIDNAVALEDDTSTDDDPAFISLPVQSTQTWSGALGVGSFHSANIASNGTLYLCGCNEDGQLGDGTTTNRSTPVRVMEGVVAVSLGNSHSAAIKSDGSLWMWGDNQYGQLGDGSNIDRPTPFRLMENVAAVALGGSSSAAIKTDGSLWVWGSNQYGQLGDGTTTDRSRPFQLMQGVATISIGIHSAAVKSDGSLWMWGCNDNGQLGDGTTTSKCSPFKLMQGVASADVGYAHTAAVKLDGTLWTWGDNFYGQLGDGTTVDGIRPTQVMGDVSLASLGTNHSSVVKSDGTLWTWGNNAHGQLGDGTNTDRAKPVQVMDGVAAVANFATTSAAIKSDGSLWMWGQNWYGQIRGSDGERCLRPTRVIMGDPATMDEVSVLLDGRDPADGLTYSWTGSAIEPKVEVSNAAGVKLERGTHYQVSYSNNVGVGIGTVVVEGIGDYSGRNESSFRIARAAQSVRASDMSVTEGESADLGASASAGGYLTYSSSNAGVAVVSKEGVVTGIVPGTAMVTVVAAETVTHDSASKTVTITVKERSRVSQRISASDMSVVIGTTVPIGATTDGDGTLDYVTSDPSIAIVSKEGCVTGVALGTAEITIAASKTDKCKECTKKIKVSVKEPAVPRSDLEKYDWSEIEQIAYELGNAGSDEDALELAKKYHICDELGKLRPGNRKKVTLKDGKTVDVVVVGIRHDDLAHSVGKAGLTLMFCEEIANRPINYSTLYTWAKSDIRRWLNDEGLQLLPDDLAKRIQPVTKMTVNSGGSQAKGGVSTGTADRLWLFSARETGLSRQYEGTKYQLFDDLQSNESAEHLYGFNDYGSFWTRTTNWYYGPSYYMLKYGAGDLHDHSKRSHNVVPGFCLGDSKQIPRYYVLDEADTDVTVIEKKPIRESYGAETYVRSSAKAVQDEARRFINAMDDYLAVLKDQTERYAKNVTSMSGVANHGKLLEQAVADKGKLVTMPEGMPDGAKDAAYRVLAEHLDSYVASEPFARKVNMSADSITIATNLVNEIRNNACFTSITRRYGGYTVRLNATAMWSSGVEFLNVRGSVGSWDVVSVTNATDTAKLLTAYVEQLKLMEKDALYEALSSVLADFASVTGISDLAKGSIKKALEKRVTQLQQCGFGNLFKYCNVMRDGYDILKPIVTAKDERSVTKALRDINGISDKIGNLDLTDVAVTNRYVSRAMEKVTAAQGRLERALFDYLYDPEREEDPGFWASLWNDVKRILFQCPVDVFVYDADGKEIGSVEGNVATASDGISVSVNGDVKEILIPDGMRVRIEAVGTDEGEMTCVVEQAVCGEPTGRAVWHDLPLSEGILYSRTIEEASITEESAGIISSDAKEIKPSTWLSADRRDACVTITVASGEGGTATGSGTYSIGEPVALSAYPDDEFHKFEGWYINDELVSTELTYRLPAKDSFKAEARFVSVRVEDDAWEGAVAKTFADVCVAKVYKASDGLSDVAVGMAGMESELPRNVTIKCYRGNSRKPEVSRKEVLVEDGYRAVVSGLSLSGVSELELLLEDGRSLATVMPTGSGVRRVYLEPYAILYSDGDLVIQRGDETDPTRGEPEGKWVLDEDATYDANKNKVPWYRHLGNSPDYVKVTKVTIADRVRPASISKWFSSSSIEEIRGLEKLDTSRVTSMREAFRDCGVKELDISGLDTSNVTDMAYMFYKCAAESIDISGLDTSNVTDMAYMFNACCHLKSLDTSRLDTSAVTDMQHMFGSLDNTDEFGLRISDLDVSGFDTSNVTRMNSMFEGMSSVGKLDVSGFRTSKVTDMAYMFARCYELSSVDVSSFDTSNVTNMNGMFVGTKLLRLDLSSWNTAKVGSMSLMFAKSAIERLDVSNFSTSSLTDIGGMFSGCSNLKSMDLSSFDTCSVTDFSEKRIGTDPVGLFEGCSSLTSVDMTGVNMSACQLPWTLGWTFKDCPSLEKLSVGQGFNYPEAFPFGSSPVARWWSVSARKWLSDDEIRTDRVGVSDTYTTFGAGDLSSDAMVIVPTQTYTGAALTPILTVRVGNETLEQNADYAATYTNNVDAGTATVTIKGKGNYTGTKTATFSIAKARQSVSAAARTISPGERASLGAKTNGGGKLTYSTSNRSVATVDADGVVTGVGPGTTKVTVTASATRDWAAASRTVTITVKAIDISKATVSKVGKRVETGKKIKPSPTVRLGGVTLRKGVDYTLSYKSNKKMGKATVVITGKGRYAGTRRVTFRILGDLSLATCYYAAPTKRGGFPKVTRMVYRDKQSGRKSLKRGRDYTMKWRWRKGGGATLTIRGKGKYGGKGVFEFDASEI